MANNPQEDVRELKDLVVAYAKQETIEPLTGLRRYVGFGIAGALLMGSGVCFLAIGFLRAMQSNRAWIFHGNWSWVPYMIDVILLIVIAALVWFARSKRSEKNQRSPKP